VRISSHCFAPAQERTHDLTSRGVNRLSLHVLIPRRIGTRKRLYEEANMYRIGNERLRSQGCSRTDSRDAKGSSNQGDRARSDGRVIAWMLSF
jgi:hypothetical protein